MPPPSRRCALAHGCSPAAPTSGGSLTTAHSGICPADVEVMAEWGHVRRGYRLDEMDALFGRDHDARATFISPVTVIAHDSSRSRTCLKVRRWRSPHRAA